MATFSPSWTLPSVPVTANAPANRNTDDKSLLKAFPAEWTLASIPESAINDVTSRASSRTLDQRMVNISGSATPQPTIRSDRPAVIFEKSWILPQDVAAHVPAPPQVLPSRSWSPNTQRHEQALRNAGFSVPNYALPGPSSHSAQYELSPAGSAEAALPGSFRPQAFSYIGPSPSSVEQRSPGSAMSAGSIVSYSGPKQNRMPRPAGYAPENITPHNSAQASGASAGASAAYVPGPMARPAAYAPDNITPHTSAVAGGSVTHASVSMSRPAAFAPENITPDTRMESSTSATPSLAYAPGSVVRPAGFANYSSHSTESSGEGQSYNPAASSQDRGYRPSTVFLFNTSPGQGDSDPALYPYRPQRPAGFAPSSLTPQDAVLVQERGVSDQALVDEPDLQLPTSRENWMPKDAYGNTFAPIELPMYVAEVDETKPWLFADLDQIYKLPAAPLTATAPWHSDLQGDTIQWRNL